MFANQRKVSGSEVNKSINDKMNKSSSTYNMLDISDKYCPSIIYSDSRRRSTIIHIDPVVDEIQEARVSGEPNVAAANTIITKKKEKIFTIVYSNWRLLMV